MLEVLPELIHINGASFNIMMDSTLISHPV